MSVSNSLYVSVKHFPLYPNLDSPTHLHESFDVEGDFGHRFEMSHDGDGVAFAEERRFVEMKDGEGKTEKNFGTLQQEAVPYSQERL